MEKIWQIAATVPDDILRTEFSELPPVVSQILWNRGLRTKKEIDYFLNPDWSRDTYSPSLFSRMPEAVARVFHALENGEKITVHGDYDADGVCGSALLMITLRDIIRAMSFPSTLSVFLPHREKDGYGLSVQTVEHLHQHEKTVFIITVDCGISNHEAITRARQLGMEVIVCDHHQIPSKLPIEAIILHPLAPEEIYPNKKLCGTGVAFKLACSLIDEMEKRLDSRSFSAENYKKWLLDLVAIATVTDVVSLTGENRALEKFGLIVLNKTKRVGLRALCRVAGLEDKTLDTWSVGFQIGPRLNAAGRMDHANAAYELLVCEDPVAAHQLAENLQRTNSKRQQASDALFEEAKRQIGEAGDKNLLFVVGAGWLIGLAGLIAGKLAQEFSRPAFVLCQEGNHYVGSGRGAHGFDVTAALRLAAPHLERFGGHPEACGLSIVGEDNILALQKIISEEADRYFSVHDKVPILQIDAEIPASSWRLEEIEFLMKTAPHGQDNPPPIFKTPPMRIIAWRQVGSGAKHLRLEAVECPTGRSSLPFIWFGHADYVRNLSVDAMIEIAYQVGLNEWNGRREPQYKIIDLRSSDRNL